MFKFAVNYLDCGDWEGEVSHYSSTKQLLIRYIEKWENGTIKRDRVTKKVWLGWLAVGPEPYTLYSNPFFLRKTGWCNELTSHIVHINWSEWLRAHQKGNPSFLFFILVAKTTSLWLYLRIYTPFDYSVKDKSNLGMLNDATSRVLWQIWSSWDVVAYKTVELAGIEGMLYGTTPKSNWNGLI